MKPRCSHDHPRGWTLIELAVVLALTGLLALLAYPSFDRLVDRLLLRSASVTLVQTLRTARQHAMVEGQSRTVVIDAVPLPLRVRFGAAGGVLGPPSQPTQSPPPDGVSFRDGRITFRPDGTLSPGPGAIYLTSGPSGPTLAISLNMAGHLRRYRWEGGRWEPI